MYSVYNNQATRDHIKPLTNANNIHKQSIKSNVECLETRLKTLDIIECQDNTYSWIYQCCLVLINNRATSLYWQLPDNIYYDLLDIGLIILSEGAKANYYMPCKNMMIPCIYFLNKILNIFTRAHNFELDFVNNLQQYITNTLATHDKPLMINGLIVLYTNIKKLEQITGTQYKDTPGSFKWCLTKMLDSLCSGSFMLEVLPSSVLSAGLLGGKELLTEPVLDMLEFQELFQHINLWQDNNTIHSTYPDNNLGQEDSTEIQQAENDSVYMLEDVEPDENELLDDDWS